MMRVEPLAPVVAHHRGPSVEGHLHTMRSIWGTISGRGSIRATTICRTDRKQYINWTEFAQICTNFVPTLYKLHKNLCIHTPAQTHVGTKFIPILCEFHPISQKSKQAHRNAQGAQLAIKREADGPGPVGRALGLRHAGAVFPRCHNVIGPTGRATPEMVKWISCPTSTLSP